MKLATLKNGTRDGKLVVVSRDLTRFTDASFLVSTLQAALLRSHRELRRRPDPPPGGGATRRR